MEFTKENAGHFTLETINNWFKQDNENEAKANIADVLRDYPNAFTSENEQAMSEEQGYPFKHGY